MQQQDVMTERIIDAGGDLNLIPDGQLEAAGIDDACEMSNDAHEHHTWPIHLIHPTPGHKGMDEKALLGLEGLLQFRKGRHGQMA